MPLFILIFMYNIYITFLLTVFLSKHTAHVLTFFQFVTFLLLVHFFPLLTTLHVSLQCEAVDLLSHWSLSLAAVGIC